MATTTAKTLTDETPFGRVLREQGRRQDWLANKVGVSKFQMSRWVKGSYVPHPVMQKQIADLLGVKVEKVFPQ